MTTAAQPGGATPARKKLFANSHALHEEVAAAAASSASSPARESSPRVAASRRGAPPLHAAPFEASTEASASGTNAVSPETIQRAQEVLENLYSKVKAKWPGFIARDGQQTLMNEALLAFLNARSEDAETQGANLATIEAGTGTGKTVAYCLAAIAASRVTGKKVIISTATVALQEQLVERDLPRLSDVLGGIEFEILKGRNRYVCKSKLEGAVQNDTSSYLFDDDEGDARPENNDRFVVVAKDLSDKLDKGQWNGESDTLPIKLDGGEWRKIQAESATCTGSKCSNFRSCSFYTARAKAKGVPILVGNHALVLSNLARDASILAPADHLFVFDEAHHLPDIAADQFATNARLASTEKVLGRLRTTIQKASKDLSSEMQAQQSSNLSLLTGAAERIRSLAATLEGSGFLTSSEPMYRFKDGIVPVEISDLFLEASKELGAVYNACSAIQADMKATAEQLSPSERAARGKSEGEIAMAAQLVREAAKVCNLMSRHEGVPLVKWIELVPAGHGFDFRVNASPLTPAAGLHARLWSKVSAALCTSATMTACGSFDYYDRLTGLSRMPERRSAVVESPFDYQSQGLLRVAPMVSNPKAAGFSAELETLLPSLLEGQVGGQLVLFTSKRQMNACYEALPPGLKSSVLVQGQRARGEMLKEHASRVQAGKPSVLFGLQSLGEGIDLPGNLCTQVIIDKLPFVPPTTPADAALSEWLEAQGRDAFSEIAVPKASMKLAQWVGRGIRTVTDKAIITVCDTRLATTGYGRSIIAGLPAFPLEVMKPAGHTASAPQRPAAPPAGRHFKRRAST